MKSKYLKNTSLLIVLVILLSYSIIPVSAAIDYDESTYNGYNYDINSRLQMDELFAFITYAGPTRLHAAVSYCYYNGWDSTYNYDGIVSSDTSSTGIGVGFGPNLEFIDAYYMYSIGVNTVYTVGLIN
jgi:hypothetical protein